MSVATRARASGASTTSSRPAGIDATNAPWCSRPRMRGFGRSWIGTARSALGSASMSGSAWGVVISPSRVANIDSRHDESRGGAMSEAMEREGSGKGKFPKKAYEHELFRLQEELVKMEQWVA